MILAIAAGLVVVRVAGGPGAMDRFAARARTITQVSDRQAHVTAGLRLGALLPILGGGSESFAMRYEQQYLRAGGAFYARGYSPLLNMYGSAHNVFAQTFAGKGAVGLIALVLVVLTSLAAAVRTLRRPDAPPRTRVVAMIALGMIAAFAIYGQVQEVFYVAPLQLTVFAACGLAAALETPPGRPIGRAAWGSSPRCWPRGWRRTWSTPTSCPGGWPTSTAIARSPAPASACPRRCSATTASTSSGAARAP